MQKPGRIALTATATIGRRKQDPPTKRPIAVTRSTKYPRPSTPLAVDTTDHGGSSEATHNRRVEARRAWHGAGKRGGQFQSWAITARRARF